MKPRQRDAPSGRFVIRLSPGLHAALRGAAAQAGLSLNDYCARKLAAPVGDLAPLGGAIDAVRRAADLFGPALVAVALFGSWARAEAADGSDIDLLVVLEPGVALTRGLYRAWDEAPIVWEGRRVEPHFAHLPGPGKAVAGLWAEVAVDGVVVFERGLQLSTRLARVRRDIASGRLLRRVAHGQPYWTGAA
jgi:hypothetical protein